MGSYRTVQLPVEGGVLHAGIWGERGPVIACSHGITATHKSFELLAEQLSSDYQLIAPDHRGRGKSNGIVGGWGMAAHARDIVALLDYLDLPQADLLVGVSMGGFVAAVAKDQFRERFDRVLLVDGGLPLMDELPQGITPEQLIQAVIGPAMQRLDMSFASEQAYLDYWRAHPAFQDDWSSTIEGQFLYDLVGDAPQLRSSVNKTAIIEDVKNQLMSMDIPNALARITSRLDLVAAPRGIMNDAPLYAPERLALFTERLADFSYSIIEDVNHYTIALGEKGAKALAQHVRRLVPLE